MSTDVDTDIESVPSLPVKVQQCPECGSNRLMRDYDAAEIVCMNCGFVIAAKLADRGPEWRAFDDEQRAKRARVGAPLTYTSTARDCRLVRRRKSTDCGNGSDASGFQTPPSAT